MTSLFVAAGGGADAIAAAIIRRKLEGQNPAGHIATYAWDRLFIDPKPGPRLPRDFNGLQPVGRHNYRLTRRSAARPPMFSFLPRLAGELDTEFYLLDPSSGAVGLRAQLAELVSALSLDRVYVVDSGGDIVARGDEPELRSPLADSLVLAAADGVAVPTDVLVTAVGLDGELSPERVREVVHAVGGRPDCYRIDAGDVEWCASLFTWHPSEVNGLLFVATQGFRGTVEIRDDALQVHVGPENATVHACDHEALFAANGLAQLVAASTSLSEADELLKGYEVRSELSYQMSRADEYRVRSKPDDPATRLPLLIAYCDERPAHVDAMTLRRVAEVMHLDVSSLASVMPLLAKRYPQRYRPPLWLIP